MVNDGVEYFRIFILSNMNGLLGQLFHFGYFLVWNTFTGKAGLPKWHVTNNICLINQILCIIEIVKISIAHIVDFSKLENGPQKLQYWPFSYLSTEKWPMQLPFSFFFLNAHVIHIIFLVTYWPLIINFERYLKIPQCLWINCYRKLKLC